MRTYAFATGAGLRTVHWKQHEPLSWEGFVSWMGLDDPADRKECGGYVAGELQETVGHQGSPKCVGLHRNSRAVAVRSIATLDVDSASQAFVADAALELGCGTAMYTTWSHTPEKPRWRLLLPLSRDVKPDDYRLLVGALMAELGVEQFDKGSQEPERLMHRPSTQGSYRAHVLEGEPLDVDLWMKKAEELGFSHLDRVARTPYRDDSPLRSEEDGVHPVAAAEVASQLEALRALPQPWYSGAEWDIGVFKVACNLIEIANSNWSGYSLDRAEADLLENAPTDEVWGDTDNLDKFESARSRVGARPAPVGSTPEQDFAASAGVAWPEIPALFTDAYLCAWTANKGLGRNWCWAAGLGWLRWDGRRWIRRPDEDTAEAVRKAFLAVNRLALNTGDVGVLKAVTALLSKSRIKAITELMRGVVLKEAGQFDHQRDLLNCGNGVIDLRTGELLPHDRSLMLTKMTEAPYFPGSTHPDWDTCLTALEPEVVDWMQVRFGQAATGWPTSDDVLPIGQGGGSNGKSTLLAGLFSALGDHMVLVPEKLLTADLSAHPTELMTVFGVRVALVEETPEAGQLNVQRMKALIGTERMTARGVYKDNVSWSPTHSLFVMSNYVPQVRETDHGTWRRLAMVRFTKTFPKLDTFRAHMSRGDGGRREAVLAWLVEGAVRWYQADQIMPEAPARVVEDTRLWRGEADLVLAFLEEGHIVIDPTKSVLVNDLLEGFNQWLLVRGNAKLSASTLSTRISGHQMFKHVFKAQTRDREGLTLRDTLVAVPSRPWVWKGIGWAK